MRYSAPGLSRGEPEPRNGIFFFPSHYPPWRVYADLAYPHKSDWLGLDLSCQTVHHDGIGCAERPRFRSPQDEAAGPPYHNELLFARRNSAFSRVEQTSTSTQLSREFDTIQSTRWLFNEGVKLRIASVDQATTIHDPHRSKSAFVFKRVRYSSLTFPSHGKYQSIATAFPGLLDFEGT